MFLKRTYSVAKAKSQCICRSNKKGCFSAYNTPSISCRALKLYYFDPSESKPSNISVTNPSS